MNEAAMRKKVMEVHEAMQPIARADQTEGKGKGKGRYVPHQPSGQLPLEESIDLLRLKVKYLLFDLEATKRENRYLRQMLDTRPRRDSDADSDGPKF